VRAGLIIGAGSASYTMLRQLVERLPVMITARWVNTRQNGEPSSSSRSLHERDCAGMRVGVAQTHLGQQRTDAHVTGEAERDELESACV